MLLSLLVVGDGPNQVFAFNLSQFLENAGLSYDGYVKFIAVL
jgi:hypothetical protein